MDLLCRYLLPVFCIILFLSQSVSAAGLVDVYHLAQKNDPDFQAANFQQQVTREKHRQAIARLLPVVEGSASYTRTTQDIKSSDNSVFGVGKTDFSTTTYTLTLTQPVFHWESIVGLRQARAENLRAAAAHAVAGQELIVRVTDLYLQALAAQDQLAFARTEQTAVEKHFELAKGRYDMGLIPITDLYDAKARMAATRAKTIEARSLLDDAMQALQEVTGDPLADLKQLRETIPLTRPDPQDIDSWIEAALKQNPAIELQKQAVAVSRQEVRRQQSGHYPTLDLIGRFNSKNTEGTLFGGGSDVDSTDVLLQFNIPLYRGGSVSSRVREARNQLKITEQQLTKQQRAIRRQTRSAYLGVNSALKRTDALHQSMVSTQLALDTKQEGFLSGLYTSLAVLDAERDLFLVKQDYARARYDYLLNSLKLKQATGSLSGQDLEQLAPWFR